MRPPLDSPEPRSLTSTSIVAVAGAVVALLVLWGLAGALLKGVLGISADRDSFCTFIDEDGEEVVFFKLKGVEYPDDEVPCEP